MAAKFTSNSVWDFEESHDRKANGKLVHYFGYDPAGKFMMHNVGDLYALSTTGGSLKDHSIDFDTSGICSFDSPPDFSYTSGSKAGLFPVRSISQGSTNLVLSDASGRAVDKIEIKVVKRRDVIVRFYNLIDGARRTAIGNPDTNPLFSTAALNSLISRVNKIVFFQCGVRLLASGTGILRDLNFSANLGNAVDILTVNPFSSSDLDHNAEFHVAFTWGISGGGANGVTKSNLCLLQASLQPEKREITLAHEFVHFLSGSGILIRNDHDELKSDLMYKDAPHGVMMRKTRLNKIIRQ
ncbi:MAG: hypothetical protein ACRCTD_16140 [Beijerinckiaceae bacterium]